MIYLGYTYTHTHMYITYTLCVVNYACIPMAYVGLNGLLIIIKKKRILSLEI